MKTIKDKINIFLIYLASLFVLASLLSIIGYVTLRGITSINPKFLAEVYPMIISTLLMIIVSIAISVPIGIFTAIYLTEYAKKSWLTVVIRFGIESLSGIPSIIYGLFGMIFFVTFLNFGFSIFSGSLTLSIMVLPLIIRTTEEALRAVPNAYREGALALGSSKLRMIFKVILPCAIYSIVTSIILSIGRIVGETAAVYLTAGMVSRIPTSIFDSGRTLAVHLYILAKEAISLDEAFATAFLLMIIILIINFIATKIGDTSVKDKD